jgi:hypothetical protein
MGAHVLLPQLRQPQARTKVEQIVTLFFQFVSETFWAAELINARNNRDARS